MTHAQLLEQARSGQVTKYTAIRVAWVAWGQRVGLARGPK